MSAETDVETTETTSLVDKGDHIDTRALGLKWRAKAEALKKARETEGSIQEDVEENEEEDGKPKDWKPIAFHSALLMIIGTGLVSVFSDPMVEVIGNFGDSLNIKAFYVSFIITPVCSNASELISSLIFATKKTKTTNSLVWGQLYGAATMNNTLVLGIFLALVFFRDLVWTFTAETICILFVTFTVGAVGSYFNTYYTWMGFPILGLYPLSLVLVWLLENKAHWN